MSNNRSYSPFEDSYEYHRSIAGLPVEVDNTYQIESFSEVHNPYSMSDLTPEQQDFVNKATSIIKDHMIHNIASAENYNGQPAQEAINYWDEGLTKLLNGEH